ncbi:MAG: hypothetical protein M3Y93_06950 [Pseudomonadota bacterium]|nr:hypothetical protein [Pseudomonadota bacterium]
MHRWKRIRYRAFLLITITAALTTGCHPAMSTQAERIQPPRETLTAPLKFARHNFAAHCYNAIGCDVVYNGRYQQENGAGQISSPPPSPDYRDKLWGSVEIGIDNFPPPADVQWMSLDGIAHEAKVDMASIFSDQLIWHKVPKAEMADFYEGPVAGEPSIFLEVNDHIINVYIKMLVPTKSEQIPGNKYSYVRDDLFLVWTRTF